MNPLETFGGIARSLMSQLCHMAAEVHMVCDTYLSFSIKDCERNRRGSHDTLYNITGPDQRRPKDWQLALKSASFRASFFRFIASEWEKDSYNDLLAGHKIYLALDNKCLSFTTNNPGALPVPL